MKQTLFLNQTPELATPLTKQLENGHFPLDRKGDLWSKPGWPESYKQMLSKLRDKIHQHFSIEESSAAPYDEFLTLMNQLYSIPLKIVFYVEGAAQYNTFELEEIDNVDYVKPGYFSYQFLELAFTPHNTIAGIDISSFPFAINDHIFLIELRGTNFTSTDNMDVTDVVVAETCNDISALRNSKRSKLIILQAVV